ncbi:MAG: DUF512 domain-containing protein [Actinomycetota bacterium]|nr:DUF512 domain-containing protein [Actinomycetota bacterium]
MPLPQVVAVATPSPAATAGLLVGDEIRTVNGQVPRDVIEYRLLVDEASVELEIARGGLGFNVAIDKQAGEPLGIEVSSPVFDRVRTCDNHCEFCFIYQLPKGMRKSLYIKDDDYRLSFLYGNFTTLTRFTELDLERVVSERLSPLNVSIHATDPELRARMLRNRRGAVSLRWLRQLLDHGIEVHGQIVVCPGLNDGLALEETFAGVLERFSELASLCCVPLGVSRFSTESAMRPHTQGEARAVCQAVERWQERFLAATGRRLVHAADEYYLLAGMEFPPPQHYEGFVQHENGIGMARAFEASFFGRSLERHAGGATGSHGGFFRSVDGAPAYGYRAERLAGARAQASSGDGVTVLTGVYGARVLRPLLEAAGARDVEIEAVPNDFFGGNVGVAGLLTGTDLSRRLAGLPAGRRYLLPDVCLSEGRFLDGTTLADLPRPVEVVATDGAALRAALGLALPSGSRRRRPVALGLRAEPAPAGAR